MSSMALTREGSETQQQEEKFLRNNPRRSKFEQYMDVLIAIKNSHEGRARRSYLLYATALCSRDLDLITNDLKQKGLIQDFSTNKKSTYRGTGNLSEMRRPSRRVTRRILFLMPKAFPIIESYSFARKGILGESD
jgi:predicted transcriptional regulator